jgi:hypothetical protein
MHRRRVLADILVFRVICRLLLGYSIVHYGANLILSQLIILITLQPCIHPVRLFCKIRCRLLHFKYLVVWEEFAGLGGFYVIISARIPHITLNIRQFSVNFSCTVDFPWWIIRCILFSSPARTATTLIIFRDLFSASDICVSIYLGVAESVALKRQRFTITPLFYRTSHFRLSILVSNRAAGSDGGVWSVEIPG